MNFRPSTSPQPSANWRWFGLALLIGQATANLGHAAATAVAWGANDSLQSQVPSGLANVVAVAGGDSHSLALRADGTVVGWGFNLFGQATISAGLSNVTSIAAGATYSLALKSNGTVAQWGSLAAPPAGLSNVVAIAAGASHALALKTDGSLVVWGSQTVVPAGLGSLVAIAAGNGHSLGLRADGTVVAWGDDSFGEAEVPAGLSNVVAIAAGGGHCLALQHSGTIVAWGRNESGQASIPANVTNVLAIGAGALHSLGLKADGSLAAWGDDTYGQVSATPTGTSYLGIAAGGYHNLVVKGDRLPAIFKQPASQNVFLGQTATFEVVALGTQPLGYQWRDNGSNILNATASRLVISNVQPSDAGTYTVVVANALGSVTSLPAILTASGLSPQVLAPLDLTAICGDTAVLRAQVDGSAPFSYQWQFQGTPIDGATNTTLSFTNVNVTQAGQYSVVVTNLFGLVTTGAVLTVTVESPHITSALSATGTQGAPFSYTIQATHSPASFGAQYFPNGLMVNTTNGVISGTPLESGTFGVVISAANQCTSGSAILVLTVGSSAPVINGLLTANGTEGSPFRYQITASGSVTNYGAQNLPPGVSVNPGTGLISGAPVIPGVYDSTIFASNPWGTASATLHVTVGNAQISGLSIANVTYTYSSPYVLDFSFSLQDNNDPTQGNALVVNPRLLSATGMEDGQPISPLETGAFISRTSTKVIKAYLVLDFTQSIASLANGDTNNDGISDAVDNMVNGAIAFVNQQSADTQLGVYEFHRDDMAPSNVVSLTTDKAQVSGAIAGIWTNYVKGFSSGSLCWDAMVAAIGQLGPASRDEEHFVILVSDGRDESSTSTVTNVISAAASANIKVFAVGFGAELDAPTLQNLATQTQGRYYTAQVAGDIANQLAQISKDAQGQYILRWATLKRAATAAFMPSFQIAYQGLLATSPTNPFTIGSTNIDNTTTPPTTNITPSITNFIIGYFYVSSNAGPVLAGSLRLVPDAEVQPTGIDLRATYVPRYIRQLRLHYRANWPCTASLQSAGPGELLQGWTMTQTNDGTGGTWLLLSSPNPGQITNSLPFASFGKLVTFAFHDIIDSSSAFSVLEVDNTLYTNTGGQSFTFENAHSFLNYYAVLPHGTPIPWLMSYGFSGDFTNAETLDSDNDGMANWQEYRANTNPTNAASVFVIRGVSRQLDGRYQVTFSSSTNRVYRVDASTDLVTWRTVKDNIPGVNQDVSVIDTAFIANLTSIFYRVLVY